MGIFRVTRRRTAASPIEQLFWRAHTKLNLRPLRGLVSQYVVGPYRIDFALPRQKIGIELDGQATHSSPGAIMRDRKRQRVLEFDYGWRIIRFGGAEVYYNASSCVREAARIVRRLS